jgi:D-glycero-D-manno-heptose 1,7-bisphosphate phosphatase
VESSLNELPLLPAPTAFPCPQWHRDLLSGDSERAIFLDRDGVLMEDTGYPDDPARITLLPGVGEPLRWLRTAGYRLVVITNQAGVARGNFTLVTLDAIHDRLRELLSDEGVEVDGIFFCPHHAKYTVAPFNVACDHRKPEPGMIRSAAAALGLNPTVSWMIGDRESDVRAGHAAGCRAVRIAAPGEAEATTEAELTAADLPGAATAILEL